MHYVFGLTSCEKRRCEKSNVWRCAFFLVHFSQSVEKLVRANIGHVAAKSRKNKLSYKTDELVSAFCLKWLFGRVQLLMLRICNLLKGIYYKYCVKILVKILMKYRCQAICV